VERTSPELSTVPVTSILISVLTVNPAIKAEHRLVSSIGSGAIKQRWPAQVARLQTATPLQPATTCLYLHNERIIPSYDARGDANITSCVESDIMVDSRAGMEALPKRWQGARLQGV